MMRILIVAGLAGVFLAWLAWGMSAAQPVDRRAHLRGYGRAK